MADGQTVEPTEIEVLSARNEGIFAFFKRENKLGWLFYGMRSFLLALIVATGFTAMCIFGFLYGETTEIKSMSFGGLQTLAVATVGWFTIGKAIAGK